MSLTRCVDRMEGSGVEMPRVLSSWGRPYQVGCRLSGGTSRIWGLHLGDVPLGTWVQGQVGSPARKSLGEPRVGHALGRVVSDSGSDSIREL